MANNGGSSWRGLLLAASYIITVHHQVQHTALHDAATAAAAAGWKRLPSQQFGCNCNKGSRNTANCELATTWEPATTNPSPSASSAPPFGPFVNSLRACDMLTRVGCGNNLSATCHKLLTVSATVSDCLWLFADSFLATTNPAALFACLLPAAFSFSSSSWLGNSLGLFAQPLRHFGHCTIHLAWLTGLPGCLAWQLAERMNVWRDDWDFFRFTLGH